MNEPVAAVSPARAWMARMGARVPGLRSMWYLLHELMALATYTPRKARTEFDNLFMRDPDPWQFESSDWERARLAGEVEQIQQALGGTRCRHALEIGCAKGAFTERLLPVCVRLTAVDCSAEALMRATTRRPWPQSVRFDIADLNDYPCNGTYDLIVVVGVLDYINGRRQMRRIRNRLIGAIEPGGLLLIGNSKSNDVLNNAWWARILVRGAKWINSFFAEDVRLEQVSHVDRDGHLDTLFRKR